MKKVLFFALLPMILGAASVNAQVKIGSVEPPEKGTILDLDATAYVGGFLLPKVEIDDLGAIPLTFTDASLRGAADAPALAGLLGWNTRAGSEGLYIWDGHDWKLLTEGNGQPPADCSGAPSDVSISGFSGTYNLNAEFAITCNATTAGVTLYIWNISDPGLQIVSGQGTNRIIVKGVTGNTYTGTDISCTVQNACGGPVSVNSATGVTINTCSGPPAAPASVRFNVIRNLAGGNVVATTAAVPEADSYVWSLPDGLTATVLETSVPSLTFTTVTAATYGAGSVKVFAKNACGTSLLSGENADNLQVIPAGPFLGLSIACTRADKSACVCSNGQPVAWAGLRTLEQDLLAQSVYRLWLSDHSNSGDNDFHYDALMYQSSGRGRGLHPTGPYFEYAMPCF